MIIYLLIINNKIVQVIGIKNLPESLEMLFDFYNKKILKKYIEDNK